MKLYVCGPMTGLPEFNYPAFHDAEDELKDVGYQVLNPANVDKEHARELKMLSLGISCSTCTAGDPHDWKWYMRRCIKMLADADGVAVLSGWQKSRGACLELDIATRIEIPAAAVSVWVARHKSLQEEYADDCQP